MDTQEPESMGEDLSSDSPSKENSGGPSVILGVVSDLYFASRIEITAGHFGHNVEFLDLGKVQPADRGESSQQIALVIIDLNQPNAVEWISRFKSTHAGENTRVIAFGSHVETDLLSGARKAGAEKALARSRFVEILPELIQELPGP